LAIAFKAWAVGFSHEEQLPGMRSLNHEDGADTESSPFSNDSPELGYTKVPEPRGVFNEKSHHGLGTNERNKMSRLTTRSS